jgi:hypothetical protein
MKEEQRYFELAYKNPKYPELIGDWEKDKYHKYGLDGSYITFLPNFVDHLEAGDCIYQKDTLLRWDGKNFRLFNIDPSRFVSLEMLLKPWRKL